MPDHTDPDWLRDAYQTMTQAEMAKAANVSRRTIGHYVNKHNIRNKTDISKDTLCKDILRVADELGRIPNRAEHSELGEYSCGMIEQKLGNLSWNDALCAIGLEPGKRRNISENALRKDILRVADKLDYSPSKAEYDEFGRYSYGTVRTKLGEGSWNNALHAVGLEPETLQNILTNDLREDLIRVSVALGRAPSCEEYSDLGEYSWDTISKKLGDGSWTEALQSVDLWPIEYDGVAMRSSYEPVVAQRLDELSVFWEYEPEQLQTEAGGYTPDFVLEDGTIIEVKGMPREVGKAPKLKELMEDRRVFVVGTEWWRDRLPCDEFILYDEIENATLIG